MFDEDLNVVNDMQEPVEGQAVEETSEGGNGEGGALETEPQKSVDIALPQTKPQAEAENTSLKELRQEAEQRARAEVEQSDAIFRRVYQGQLDPRNNMPITSIKQVEEILDWQEERANFQALEQSGINADTIKKIVNKHPEYQSMRADHDRLVKENAERSFASDLSEIKKLYPEEQAKHIKELGEEFFTLCANGISPIVAYEAIKNGRPKPVKPPSMGDIGGTSVKETTNKYLTMSDSDFEKEIQRAERGELSRGR